MLVFGYALLEIVYKIRRGPDEEESRYRSLYEDEKIGWRALAPRAQETIIGWLFDDEGGLAGARQQVGAGPEVSLPIEKLLLFRVRNENGSPAGRSPLRGVYRPWYFRTRLEEIEAVGADRDLVGYPYMQVPKVLLSDSASTEDKALRKKLWKLIIQTRRNEREGALIPAEREPNGDHSGFKLGLLQGGGRRAFDINVPIMRHRTDISTALLCGFLFLGQDRPGGSRALGGPLIRFFLNSIEYVGDEVADVMGGFGVPRLMRANGVPQELWPSFEHGNIERVDVETAAKVLNLVKEATGQDLLAESSNALVENLDLLTEPESDDGPLSGDKSETGEAMKENMKRPSREKSDLEEGGEG